MSSRKNNLLKYPIVTSGVMASSITSAVTNIQFLDNIGIQFNWTGTPTGTFTVQVSADYARDDNGNVTNSGNWITLTLSASITASGSGDTAYADLTQLSAPWIRAVYTAASGAGTLNAFIVGKMI